MIKLLLGDGYIRFREHAKKVNIRREKVFLTQAISAINPKNIKLTAGICHPICHSERGAESKSF
jgi:hypothetical protein